MYLFTYLLTYLFIYLYVYLFIYLLNSRRAQQGGLIGGPLPTRIFDRGATMHRMYLVHRKIWQARIVRRRTAMRYYKMHQNRLLARAPPRTPLVVAYDTPLDPIIGCETDAPSPLPLPFP